MATASELGLVQPEGFPSLPAGWSTENWLTQASSHGLELFVLALKKNPNPKNILLVTHGQGEHGGRYFHLPHYLHSAVDAVICWDLRGHGRSTGIRGHVEVFKNFTDDLGNIIADVERRFPQSKLHALFHSMGGLIGIDYCTQHPEAKFQSVSITSALLAFKIEFPAVKRAAANALSRVWGSLQMGTGLNPFELTHDPRVAEAINRDMLSHRKGTPRLYTELKAAMERLGARPQWSRHPLLMLVPLDDKIVNAAAELSYFRALSDNAAEKKCVELPGFYHEPMNELKKDQVFKEIEQWILKHS